MKEPHEAKVQKMDLDYNSFVRNTIINSQWQAEPSLMGCMLSTVEPPNIRATVKDHKYSLWEMLLRNVIKRKIAQKSAPTGQSLHTMHN